jgi:hypothetical protein
MAQVSGSPAKPPSIEPMLRSATTRRSLPCPVTHGYTLFAAHVSVRRTWGVGARWHKVRKILNMVTTSGKRWWLVAWDGRDELGRPWPDTWEPTAYVLKDLRDHWFAEGAARVERSIQVDVRPLDILVQRTIATAMIKDTIDTFGKVHCIEVGALTLRDLADYYLNRGLMHNGAPNALALWLSMPQQCRINGLSAVSTNLMKMPVPTPSSVISSPFR